MAGKPKGLGKGLGAFFPESDGNEILISNVINGVKNGNDISSSVTELKVIDVEPNRNQPRQYFDKEKLDMLTESVKVHGIIQPILVQSGEHGMYKIIAGERRWRAAKAAGLKVIPCIIRDYTAREVMEIALIENLQREDLNPIEEAEGYKRLMETFDLKQEELSERVGKSRSAIANILRLNGLPNEIKDMLIADQMTSGHARALAGIENETEQIEMANRIVQDGLSVRKCEEIIKKEYNKKHDKQKEVKNIRMPIAQTDTQFYKNVEERLSDYFTTKVKVVGSNSRIKIEIDCFDNEELDRIMDLIMV